MSQTESTGGSVGFNFATMTPTASYSEGSSDSTQVTHQYAEIQMGENGVVNFGNLTQLELDGAVINTSRATGNIGQVTLISPQDTAQSSSSGFNVGVSSSLFGPSNVTGSVGFNSSSSSSRATQNHSGIHATDLSGLRIEELEVQDTELDPTLEAIAERTTLIQQHDSKSSHSVNVSVSGIDLTTPQGFGQSVGQSVVSAASGVAAAELARAVGGGDLAASIAGTAASAYASHQFNTHFPSSSSTPAFRSMGEISYGRDGDETHITMVDVNLSRVERDMAMVRQAGNRLAHNLQTFFEAAPEELKPQLESLQQTNEMLEEAGVSEQQREEILENLDISEAIQVSKAIENAQKEKIRRVENRNRKGNAREGTAPEPMLLSQGEVEETANALTLAHLYKDGEEGGYTIQTQSLSSVSDETTATQDALITLVRGHQTLTRMMEEHPEQTQTLQRVATQILNTIDLMGYVAAGAQGAVMGMASGFASDGISGIVPGGLMGAAAGMCLYHETGEAIGSLMESGADRISDLAYSQGRTLEESVKFKSSTQQLLLMGATGYLALKGGKSKKQGGSFSSTEVMNSSKLSTPDYSTPEAAYSLRIDPITGKGPIHVDSNLFTKATSTTIKGDARNKDQFWKLWAEKYPETMSVENLERIHRNKNPLAPKVDNQWLQHFPEHANYLNDTIVHHHIDHGNLVTGLPDRLHRMTPGNSMFHTEYGGRKK